MAGPVFCFRPTLLLVSRIEMGGVAWSNIRLISRTMEIESVPEMGWRCEATGVTPGSGEMDVGCMVGRGLGVDAWFEVLRA